MLNIDLPHYLLVKGGYSVNLSCQGNDSGQVKSCQPESHKVCIPVLRSNFFIWKTLKTMYLLLGLKRYM